jgi:hypothetical protein
MRSARFVSLLVLITFARLTMAQQATATAPQATTSAPQATALLQQALAALSGRHPISDVTLTGTAQYIAGSDEESGTAVLKAVSAGASSVSLNLSSGNRSEIQNCSTMPPAGAWSGPDGVSHTIAYHNLLTGPAWFFPAFNIAQGLSGSGYVTTYIGPETRNGQAVQHVSFSQPSLFPSVSGGPSSAHLTQIDLFLDATTFLPSAVAFNIHPDNNALLDIPVEVTFSSYTGVSGAQVPFHIQKYINNSLALDLQFNSALLNSGLSPSIFTVGAGL